MQDFFKNLIKLDWSIPSDKQPLGSVLNPYDPRQIVTTQFQAPEASLPSDIETDISMIPFEDQKDKGTCVGQAEGTVVDFFEFLETGKVTGISRRYIYGLCKLRDGLSQQGTYPVVAAKIVTEIGAATKAKLPDDNDLEYAKYVNFINTNELIEDAYPHRTKGFAAVPSNIFDLRQGLLKNKIMTMSLLVGDWDGEYVKPTYKDGTNRGSHRIVIFRIKTLNNGDFEFHFRNSWGKKWGKKRTGNGKFLWSDYKASFFDPLVYTDIPNELLQKAKSTPFVFTKDLGIGAEGIEVIEVQKFLRKKGYFTYQFDTGYFGGLTEEAVKKYQTAKGIVSNGSPETTGWGRWGAKTRSAANADNGIEDSPTANLRPKVRKLCDNLVELCAIANMPIKITSGFRSFAEQDELYAQGRTKAGQIVTNAKGGQSMHNYGIAFDIVFFKDGKTTYEGDWEKVGRIGEILGMSWGGRWTSFVDKPHFELTMGYSLEDFINNRIDWTKFN